MPHAAWAAGISWAVWAHATNFADVDVAPEASK